MQSIGNNNHRALGVLFGLSLCLAGHLGCRSALDDFYWPLAGGEPKGSCPPLDAEPGRDTDLDPGPGRMRPPEQHDRRRPRSPQPEHKQCPAATFW